MNMNIRLWIPMLCLALLASGCNSWLDVKPYDQISEDELPGDELLNSYDGAKILWGLFNTAVQLDDKDDRNAILKLAKYMADYLDLDGWIMEKEFSIQIVTEIKRN